MSEDIEILNTNDKQEEVLPQSDSNQEVLDNHGQTQEDSGELETQEVHELIDSVETQNTDLESPGEEPEPEQIGDQQLETIEHDYQTLEISDAVVNEEGDDQQQEQNDLENSTEETEDGKEEQDEKEDQQQADSEMVDGDQIENPKDNTDEPEGQGTQENGEEIEIEDAVEEVEQQPEEEHEPEEEAEPVVTDLKDCLTVSETGTIKFGKVFSGQIKEQKFTIENHSRKKLTLKVKVVCSNKEFDDLDEYVFSIRKPPQYDYNDTYYVMMNEKDFITFHVAIKVPRIKQVKELVGQIKVTAENMEGAFNTKISAFVSLLRIATDF